MDSYTLATWRARIAGRHHQTVPGTLVMPGVLLLVVLCAGAAGAQTPAATPPARPAMGEMKMGGMKPACEAKHEASAKEVEALARTVTAAMASTDPAVLRAALEATRRHLEGMQAKAATCAAMMKTPAVAVEPKTPAAEPAPPADHKH